jgi:thiamine biosynthesis lipoprotein
MGTSGTATHDWELWSTTARLVVTDPATMSQALTLVQEELLAIELAASRFRPDSELMTLVRDADGAAELSPLLAELMEAALTAARESDGAVDPTLGSVLVGLGYDRDIDQVRRGDTRKSTTPTPSVTVVRRRHGWRSLALADRCLRMPPGTQLDLGASAKAVAADRCARLVHDRFDTGVLVSLGGDIATSGPAPDGGWQVVVQDLPSDVPQQITLAPGAAVATSSSAKRAWTQDGVRRHHLVDPATRLPAEGPWRSISVVATTCLRANTASTAAMVKGDEALAWLRTTGLPARLVSEQGALVTLGGWPREVAA